MFTFIKKLLLKKKVSKISLYVKKTETALTIFKNIEKNENKNEKLIRSLRKNNLYENIISQYNVCIQKIEQHNNNVQTLMFVYNTLLQTYPVINIINNIFKYSKAKIEEIYATVKKVYTYTIPNSFDKKREYDYLVKRE